MCLGKNSTIDPYTVFITNTQVKNFKGKVVVGLRQAATAEIDKYTSANPPSVPAPNTATLGAYDIFTYSSSCQYFDEKKNQWSAAGCSVSCCVVPSLLLSIVCTLQNSITNIGLQSITSRAKKMLT